MIELLIISKKGDHPRKRFQLAQMERLGLSGRILDAVTPEVLDGQRLKDLSLSWARPLLPTEVALTQSHLSAWKIVAETQNPCLILEDDAILAQSTANLLQALGQTTNVDLLSLETFKKAKLMEKEGEKIGESGTNMHALFNDRGGSAAYIVWPSGARKLIASVAKTCPPSDAAINLARGIARYQTVPAYAIQAWHLSQDDACYSAEMDDISQSTIIRKTKEPYPSLRVWVLCKMKRLAASWIILTRKISGVGRAEPMMVSFDPN